MADYPYYTEPTHDQGAVASAARDTSVSSAEGRLKVDAVDKVFLLQVNKHPLVALLNGIGKVYDGKAWKGSGLLKKATGNPEFKWFEDFYGGRYCKVGGSGYSTGAVTITVTGAGSSSAYIFTVGDIIKNARTGENMEVATIASATTITVASGGRSFGSTAAAAGNNGDGLYIVGNVNEENASARNINTTRSSEQTNYTQIFKTTIGASDTEKNSELYGMADMPYQRMKKAEVHALDIERAFWWGEKNSTTGSNSKPKRSTGGVHEFINSNNAYVQDQDGILTAPDMNTFLREGFTYGDTSKILFCGGILLQAINEFARGQIQTKVGQTTYGVKVQEWITAFGTVNLIHNPLFVNDYAGYGYLIDMNALKYRFMNNRDTRLHTNVQAPDVDGELDQLITECGQQRVQAAECGLLKNVTA